MKTFFKIFIGIFSLILVAVIGFAYTFDPNDYKDDIIKLVKDKTGRELTIKGDMSLSIFPWIGVDLGAIELSNAKGFGKKPFAKMEHLQVRAKLWPLIQQQLVADTVVIEGLHLNLAKNKKGISNWDDLINKPAAVKSKPKSIDKQKPQHKSSSKPDAPTAVAAIALNGLEIKDAQFNWHDKQTKQKIAVKDIQLSIAKLQPETKIPFTLAFQTKEKSLDALTKLETNILISEDYNSFTLYDTQLNADINHTSLKKQISPKISSPLIQLDLKKQTINLKNLTLAVDTIKLQSQLHVKNFSSTPYLDGKIILNSFSPRQIANDFAIKLPQLNDNKTLNELSAQIDAKGTFENINLSNIELSLDDTKMVGNAKIKLNAGTSKIELTVDKINIDRYLPKAVAKAKNNNAVAKQAVSTGQKQVEPVLIPIALLSNVNLDTRFKIKKIQIKSTHWSDFNFVTHSKNGHIEVKPLSMHGYDATIKSNFNLKVKNNSASLSGNLDIKDLNAGKLLNDYINKDKLKGKTSLTASFTTSGIKLSQLKQNLNGKLNLNIKDGVLKGFALNHELAVLDAKIKKRAIPATPTPAETKIAKLDASAIIKNGVLNNKDLRAVTPLSQVIGQGSIDIANEKLNYTTTLKFASVAELKANTPFEKIKSFPLDVRITGTFDNPKITPDFQKVLNSLVKREIKKHEQKIKDKVKNDIKKALEKNFGKDLNNLFKR